LNGESAILMRRDPMALARNLSWRMAILIGGLLCFAFGIVLTLNSGVGLGSWDVFHQGLARRTGLTIGQANTIVGAFILLLAWALGARPGIATVLNMLLIGVFVDFFLRLGVVPTFVAAPLPLRVLVDVVGVAVVALGTACYIKANLGAGPRDGLMLALTRRIGWRVSVIRAAIELTVVAFGFLLGGTAGIGTLIFAFGIGPLIGVSFRLFKMDIKKH
jgi:uncharacterized membrane protein YczE